jgi:hypothetical protein
VSTLFALAVVLCGVAFFDAPSDDEIAWPSLPPLSSMAPTCSHSPETARDVAQQREQAARLRWERAALVPGAGPTAYADMQLVVACYRVAGDVAAAERAAVVVHEYANTIEHELRHQQLRLKIAVGRGDDVLALQTIAVLQALLDASEDGAYVRWLARLRRDLESTGAAR